ncbi:DUF4221 family protein [Algoriphagus sp. PAP.12]|uniref:DUF4221 family protein n=1 Tax=Algoriphagus sp. PAP.12 TaxID=2996678 RepID=UPI00227A5B07|nr:DUF4221 family protein [Algoriphagus sp. PAP.12]
MSKLYFPLLCFLFLIGLFACESEKTDSNSAVKTWELAPSGEKIEIELDSTTANVSVVMEYYDDGESPLFFNVNWDKNSLQIYDVKDHKLEKELLFEQEGPNGVRVGFVHIHNLDSIFLFPEWSKEMVLIDSSGEIKNRIKYELPETVSAVFLHNTYYVSPPMIADGKLIAKTRGVKRPTEYTQLDLDEFPILVSIDLKSGDVNPLPYRFPNNYLIQGKKMLEKSIIAEPERLIISFIGDHSLYFSDGERMAKKEAASSFLEPSLPLLSEYADGREFAEYAFTKSRYADLINDPYRKLYYRFAYPTIEIDSDEQLRELRENPGPFVIMVFDENLDLLTEKKFEAGKYMPTNSFVGEKGLYISINNPENPENKEDWMSFELIELVEK